MAYTLKQIYAALAAVENGPDMIADLQTELSNVRSEAAQRRTEKQHILKSLGVDDETGIESIAATLAALSKTGAKPDEIGKQIAALSEQVKTLTDAAAASEQQAQTEKDKRIAAIKANKALAALQAGNAANPEVISKLILDKLVAKDDDNLVYSDDGKEISVEDGVKNFLAANPWAVKNVQNPGGGSGPGGDAGGRIYSKAEIEAMTPDQINKNWDDVQASMQKI